LCEPHLGRLLDALRFWDLPFDPTLTEWLQDLDLSAASVQAAREFAGQHALWAHTGLDRDGLADRLVSEDGFLEKLVAEGGTLDQLVELGRTLERLQPRVAELIGLIPELHESVDTLNRSVGPIGELANRLPGGRRRPALEG
jgi:hypothetical protein